MTTFRSFDKLIISKFDTSTGSATGDRFLSLSKGRSLSGWWVVPEFVEGRFQSVIEGLVEPPPKDRRLDRLGDRYSWSLSGWWVVPECHRRTCRTTAEGPVLMQIYLSFSFFFPLDLDNFCNASKSRLIKASFFFLLHFLICCSL